MIFALLTRRFRSWLFAGVLAPLLGAVLRRVGLTLQARRGSTPVSRALLSAGAALSGLRAKRKLKRSRRTRRGRFRR